jgi:hypothetical protein
MNRKELIENIELEGVIIVLGVLYKLLGILHKIDPDPSENNYRIEKFKTKKYHVQVLLDSQCSPTILIREKGLLRRWELFEKDKGTPPELMGEIDSDQCTPERRKYLLTKIINLKAFW